MSRVQPAPDLLERLAPIVLPDNKGKKVTLGDTWKTKPVVLAHLRHFGCLYCRQRASDLKKAAPAVAKLGASLVAIGTGDGAYAARFVEEFELPFVMLSDDDLISYKAVGAVDTHLINWMKPSNLMAMAKSMQLGYRQSTAGKHQSALGATHVIFPGRVALSWINDDFSSDIHMSQVLDAVEDL